MISLMFSFWSFSEQISWPWRRIPSSWYVMKRSASVALRCSPARPISHGPGVGRGQSRNAGPSGQTSQRVLSSHVTPDAAPRHPDLAHHPAIDVIGAWPEDRPLAVVLAGDPAGRTTRSLIAEPVETRQTATFESAMRLINTTKTRNAASPSRTSPFGPGWLASIAYRCGSEIEPAARVTERCIQDQWPAAILARINDGWVFDNRTGRWSSFGSPAPLANPKDPGPAGFQIGEVFGLERERAYIRAVRRAVELIHAGDAFQVNLTHRLWASFKGSPRSLFAELARRLRPWHAVYLECPARSSQPGPTAIASFSPELFLELAPGGRVTTRPMKGT
ncbi:MAG TPA: hypothetical protein ENJ00_00940, partial [Phycisphaerales bacterium]|nr:hypothetical protein [Phycisphaerales bacterium]